MARPLKPYLCALLRISVFVEIARMHRGSIQPHGRQRIGQKRSHPLRSDGLLTHGSLRIALAVLDATTDGKPPSCPRRAGITAAQEEQTIVAVHQENTGRPPLCQRHEPRCYPRIT